MPDDVKLMTLADLDEFERRIRGRAGKNALALLIEHGSAEIMAATIRRLAEFPREIVAHAEYLHEVGLSGIVADATVLLAELEKPDGK